MSYKDLTREQLINRIENNKLLTLLFDDKTPTVGTELWVMRWGNAEKVRVMEISINLMEDENGNHYFDIDFTAIRFLDMEYVYFDYYQLGSLYFFTKEECEEFERNKPF